MTLEYLGLFNSMLRNYLSEKVILEYDLRNKVEAYLEPSRTSTMEF